MSLPEQGADAALECLRAVLALARAQATALAAEDLEAFNQLLDERAALLGRLESLTTTGLDALESTAREIMEQDRHNQAALGDRLGQVRTELPILAAGSRAAGAYRVAPEATAAYVDRSS